MKIILSMLAFAPILLYGQADTVTSCQGMVTFDSVYTVQVHRSLPKFHLHAIARTDQCYDLTIWHEGQSDTLQRVQHPLDSKFDGDSEFWKFLQLVDINYDGYKDLQLFDGHADPFNICYTFWVFDPQSGTFQFDEDISEKIRCNPDIHIATKTVTLRSVGGCLGMCYTWEKYRFLSGHYILAEKETQQSANVAADANGKHVFVRTLSVLRKGEMILVKKVTGTIEEIFKKWYKDPKYWEAEEAERDHRGGA